MQSVEKPSWIPPIPISGPSWTFTRNDTASMIRWRWNAYVACLWNDDPFQNFYLILVTFGRLVGASVEPLENFQTLQQSTTLYCSTDVNINTARIGWSFTPFGQEIEESLTDSAQWESAFGMSKLYISTSKLGYYSCYTSDGDVLKRYTVKLTQPALEKGMCAY